jgi:hypothetical protein
MNTPTQTRSRLLSSKLRFEVGFTEYRSVAANPPGNAARQNDASILMGAFENPNALINVYGSTYFDRGLRGHFGGTYRLPWSSHLGWICSYQDGLPYGRILPVTGLNQGLVGILATRRGPGDGSPNLGKRTEYNLTVDVRWSRTFRFSHYRADFLLDVYNLLNQAHAFAEADITSPNHLWRIPLQFQAPRSLELGLRLSW